ncbi:MAG TPA: tetratricopeptide repeat protein [Usitatibacter sp.]|nr:tetratricopeptide repeat protein [Usitatibacter sp.]
MSTPAPIDDGIVVFDKYGREFQVTREHWRTQVLPAALHSNWDRPEELYGGILQGLNDGFIDEVADAVKRLRELEPDSARAAAAYGFVLLKAGQAEEARGVLEGHLAKHGREATVLNNLAKVYDERGDKDRVERTLWQSLEDDPNQENSCGWFEALHRERGGSAAAADALRRIAALPGSWRARLSLARYALDARDVRQAMALYQEALATLGANVPAEVLMVITGDLGKRGYLAQLIEIAAQRFVPERDGVQVGNNLIKAYVDAGRIAEARALLERLFALNRPDWKSTLTFWDGALVQAETSRNAPVGSTVEMTMYVIEGPVWAHAGSPVATLFPPAPPGAPRVVFLGSTAEGPHAPSTPQIQLSDAAGRLSRVIPLYLAEQAQFHSGAHVRGLFPWMINNAGGSFVLTTEPPTDMDAIERAKGGGPCDFVVVTHVKAKTVPWSATLRVLRIADGRCVFTHEAFATPDRPDVIAAQLAIEIQRALEEHAHAKAQAPAAYLPPAPPHLASYLLRLEQLLAIRCATSPTALHGVREIMEGCLHLCLDFPKSVIARALLADVVARMRNIRPDVVGQFQERLRLLEEEHPLPEPAQSTLHLMFQGS